MEYYTAYVLTCGGKERVTGILAVSEDHARAIAKLVWSDRHGWECPFRVQVRLDDLN